MDVEEARNRLLVIARDRLRDRPGAYRKFLSALTGTVVGQAMMTRATSFPTAWEHGELCGSEKASQRIAEHLTGVVDWWAQSQRAPQAMAPLPAALSAAPVMPSGEMLAGTATEKKRVTRRWWDAAGPYMVAKLRAGQFSSVKQFDAALRAEAGASGSPFDNGTGAHRGSLYVRELGKPLTLKTIQNNWQTLKKAAANGS